MCQEHAMKAQRWNRGITLPLPWRWMRVGDQRHALTLYPRERDPVPTVLEAGWAPRPVWKDAENLAPTDNRSPDRAARGKSLYRLSYPGVTVVFHFNFGRSIAWWCRVIFPLRAIPDILGVGLWTWCARKRQVVSNTHTVGDEGNSRH